MSSRRRLLVSRPNQDAPSPSSGRDSSSAQRVALPPYQAPACPLTDTAYQQLASLTQEADHGKYQKHLSSSVSVLVSSVVDSNDALSIAKDGLKKQVEKRKAREARQSNEETHGESRVEKSEEELAAEEHIRKLDAKVEELTKEAEQAMRELVDYSAELKGQDALVRGIAQQVAAQMQERRNNNLDADDADGDADATAADILSPTELLQQAKQDTAAAYARKSMKARYADNVDYQTFRKLLHDASYYGQDAPPLPPPSTWFSADAAPGDSLRSGNAAAAAADSDEELVFAGSVQSLKCPLTLQLFKAPYSNHKCRHTFEKDAFLEMFQNGSTVYGARGARSGTAMMECPQAGCRVMLELGDMFEDQMVARQVKRMVAREAAENMSDEEEEEEPVGRRVEKKRKGGEVKTEDRGSKKPKEQEEEDEVLVPSTQM